MARVEVEVANAEVQGRPGVVATCSQCDHTTECLGRSQRSARRCLVLLRESCPEGEENFYVDPDVEDRDP